MVLLWFSLNAGIELPIKHWSSRKIVRETKHLTVVIWTKSLCCHWNKRRRPAGALHVLVPLINMQKWHFLAFCENCRSHIPEILYSTKTYSFTSGTDNCASYMCKLLQCAPPYFCSVKWGNGNSFYLFLKVEILDVDTLDFLLPETNRLLKDLKDR